MTIHLKKILCFLLAALMFAVALAACGVDPNVKQNEESSQTYEVKIDKDEEEKMLDGYHSYGAGKTDPVSVGGVEVEVTDFAIRSYELAYMIAQRNFKSVDQIQIDPLVQFAFAHVFFRDLNEMNNKAMQYRETKEAQIKEQLMIYFGRDDFDVKKSVLYNPGKQIFEMWIPEYGCNIYYKIDAVNIDKDKAEIITTFYNELKRETMLGRTTIGIEIKDGKPVISSLATE